MCLDNPCDFNTMVSFTKGALWGIIPSILFFVIAFFCFKGRLNLPVVLHFAVFVILLWDV